uniref:Sushi domain-containing protein n=1 Tax=Scleropages formosus TaxID=113540 RepID=A0A8C9R0V9_SCLFO
MDCGNFEFPADIADTINDKEQLRFSCQIGYTGMVRFTCEDGSWIKNGRGCHPKQCGHPGDTPNGDFTLTKGEDFVFGSEVQYTCKKGYVMVSRVSHRSCLDKGWDNSVPICEEQTCSVLYRSDVDEKSFTQSSYKTGEKVYFTCKGGYRKKENTDYITCTEGVWEPRDMCEGKRFLGKKPITTLSRECPYNTLFLYFSAKEKLCNKPPINQGYIYPVKTTYNNEEILYYACITGYKPTTEGWWGHITCTNRAWSHNPKCIVQRDEYSNGETVHVQCNTGYEQVRRSAECLNGNWILPECTETGLPCKAPPRIENAVIISPYEETYLHASKVTFKCHPLFGIEGKEEVECRNGNWAVLPRCIRKNYCDKPDLKNGKFIPEKETYNNEEEIEYVCHKPYDSIPAGSVTCQNGQWTKRLSCKELPTIENGDRISEKQEGDLYKEVTFQCPRSYKLEGKEIHKLPSTVYVEEGKTYRFTCKSRYYKDTWYWSTNVEGICKNGHMEFPTCK